MMNLLPKLLFVRVPSDRDPIPQDVQDLSTTDPYDFDVIILAMRRSGGPGGLDEYLQTFTKYVELGNAWHKPVVFWDPNRTAEAAQLSAQWTKPIIEEDIVSYLKNWMPKALRNKPAPWPITIARKRQSIQMNLNFNASAWSIIICCLAIFLAVVVGYRLYYSDRAHDIADKIVNKTSDFVSNATEYVSEVTHNVSATVSEDWQITKTALEEKIKTLEAKLADRKGHVEDYLEDQSDKVKELKEQIKHADRKSVV